MASALAHRGLCRSLDKSVAETKALKRELRQLAEEAYRRELDAELAKLAHQFERWRRSEINPWELSDQIHEFHNGVNRRLYVQYRNEKPRFAVANAVARGVLRRQEVSAQILKEIDGLLQVLGDEEKG